MNKTLRDQLGIVREDLEEALDEAQDAVDELHTAESQEVYDLVNEALHAVEDALRVG